MTKKSKADDAEAPQINPDDLATLQGEEEVRPGDLKADLVAPDTIEPADEVEAHEVEAPVEPWPPTGPIVVHQDKHNGPATVISANEDHTLDLRADLFGLGHEITLFGVARRQGSGNGWEPV